MKRLLSILTVFLLVSTSLFAEGIREREPAPVNSQQGSSVWKITKDGKFMFLGGSVHILREDDLPLPREFNYAFSNSEVLVLEADTEQLQDPETALYFLTQMYLPGNLTLQDVLDAETYELLSFVCSDYGIPIESVSHFKPALVITMLAMLDMEDHGFDQQGVDDYFQGKARANNKPVVFMEPVEAQITMLVTMGEGYENDFVRYSLMDMDSSHDDMDTLMNDWKTGNSSSSEETLLSMKEEWPKIYKSLITDRHDAWLPQIEEFISSGKVHFVVAGLLHMHGPDGLLKVLKDLGYGVEQVVVENR